MTGTRGYWAHPVTDLRQIGPVHICNVTMDIRGLYCGYLSHDCESANESSHIYKAPMHNKSFLVTLTFRVGVANTLS